jgi:hypothetical protein
MPRPGRFTPGNRPGIHCVGGWVGPKAGLKNLAPPHPTRIRPPDRVARSESLKRLSYPRSKTNSLEVVGSNPALKMDVYPQASSSENGCLSEVVLGS